jgi:hypothetical protein
MAMKPGTATMTALALTVLVPGAALVGAATNAAAARAADSEQRIYLDPETGEVLEQPPAADRDEMKDATDGTRARQRRAPAAPEAWTNDEGAEMLTPNPDAAPSTRAVRCPDGSLRMGHADRAADDASVVEALCQQHSD